MEWKTMENVPPEGVVLMTKIDDEKGCRYEQTLIKQGNLWVYPCKTMYIYYSPTHWKPVKEAS